MLMMLNGYLFMCEKRRPSFHFRLCAASFNFCFTLSVADKVSLSSSLTFLLLSFFLMLFPHSPPAIWSSVVSFSLILMDVHFVASFSLLLLSHRSLRIKLPMVAPRISLCRPCRGRRRQWLWYVECWVCFDVTVWRRWCYLLVYDNDFSWLRVTSGRWRLAVWLRIFFSFILAVYLVSRHFNQCEFVWSNLWCCYITYLRLHNARTYTRTHFGRRWLCARTNFYFLREKVLPSSAMCLNELSPTCTQIPTMHSFGGDAMADQKKWMKSTTAKLVHIVLGPSAEPKYCNLFRRITLLWVDWERYVRMFGSSVAFAKVWIYFVGSDDCFTMFMAVIYWFLQTSVFGTSRLRLCLFSSPMVPDHMIRDWFEFDNVKFVAKARIVYRTFWLH